MGDKSQISRRLIAAARPLTVIGQAEFAVAAGLSVEALCLMEADGSAWLRSEQDVEAVSRGLQHTE